MRFVLAIVVFFALGMVATIFVRSADDIVAAFSGENRAIEPPVSRELAFRNDCFGRSSLRGCVTGLGDDELATSSPPEFVHYRGVGSRFREAALSVGRLDLRVLKNDGTKAFVPCTGVLIDDKFVLTANHCRVDPASRNVFPEILEGRFVLGFTNVQADAQAFNVRPKPVEACDQEQTGEQCLTLDYAIFELSEGEPDKAKAAGFRSARLDTRDPRVGQDLFIIHHPAGRPQVLSTQRCFVGAAESAQINLTHNCWTFGGSSGAPIFDDVTSTVVGIHVKVRHGVSIRDHYGVGFSIATLSRHSRVVRDALQRTSGRSPSGE